MPCRFASSGTVATSRSASRAILALNVASNFLRDLVISVLHRLRQSRTLHTLTFGPISGVHFILVVLFRLFLSRDLLDEAKKQANKGIAGRMEGHAKMDMSVGGDGTLWQRITSAQGFTAISHYFVMDWASVWLDIAGGLLI